ncbi:MAG: Hsp20/alpha crystallin family protein [Gemmataceae bacterium]
MFGLMPRKRELAPREYGPLEAFRKEFETLFNRTIGSLPALWEPARPWGVEMEEGEKEVMVKFELPGFELSELNVELRGSVLKVMAEHKEPEKKEPEEYRRYERTVTLPEGVEPEKVEAVYRNGVLEVRVPRAPESRPRVIEVKT